MSHLHEIAPLEESFGGSSLALDGQSLHLWERDYAQEHWHHLTEVERNVVRERGRLLQFVQALVSSSSSGSRSSGAWARHEKRKEADIEPQYASGLRPQTGRRPNYGMVSRSWGHMDHDPTHRYSVSPS